MEKFSNDLLILCWWDGLKRKNISTRKSGKSIKFIKRCCSCYENKKCTLISVFLVIQFFLCCYFCFELLLPLLRGCCCYTLLLLVLKKKINCLWCWFFVAVVTAARIWYQCWNQCLIHSLMAYNTCYNGTLQPMFWLTSRSTIPTQHSNSMKFYFWISINFVRLLKFIISIIF